MADKSGLYPPLNRLKPVAGNVFIVDGPAIRFGPPGLKMPFPTRMTVLRLEEGLFIHSPTALTADLKAEIEALGPVRFLIGPNRLHYWWIPDWREAFRQAEVYLAPRIGEQAKGRIAFPTLPLDRENGYPWDREILTLPVTGSYMTEAIFFHKASRTLILTDFIENFEHATGFTKLLIRLGGVRAPDGQMPRDMRFTFRKARPPLKEAVERMIAWNPERIVIAHGRWFEENGAAELKRAFRWLL